MTKTSVLRTILLILRTVTAFCAVFFLGAECTSGERQKTAREGIEVVYADTVSRNTEATVEGTLQARRTADLSFRVSGMLEPGETKLSPGTRFRKGQLLAQINNREAFTALNRSKGKLSTLVLQTLPDIRSRFPAEENKWLRFMERLLPQFLAPEMPPFSSPAERDLITEKGIPPVLSALQQEQADMAYYFYLAPFDGYVLEVKKQPGSEIRKGTVVARLAENGPQVIVAFIPDTLQIDRSYSKVTDVNGHIIGLAYPPQREKQNGKVRLLFHFDSNNATRFAVGTPVTVTLHPAQPPVYVIPSTAVDGDLVQIVRKGKLETRQVTIVGKEGNALVVSGLKNGDAVVSSYRQQPDRAVYYFPKKG